MFPMQNYTLFVYSCIGITRLLRRKIPIIQITEEFQSPYGNLRYTKYLHRCDH